MFKSYKQSISSHWDARISPFLLARGIGWASNRIGELAMDGDGGGAYSGGLT